MFGLGCVSSYSLLVFYFPKQLTNTQCILFRSHIINLLYDLVEVGTDCYGVNNHRSFMIEMSLLSKLLT